MPLIEGRRADGTTRTVSIDENGNLSVVGEITVSSTVEVTNDEGNPLPVSGTVTIGNLEAAPVPVAGTVTVDNLAANAVPVEVVSGTITINAGDLTIGDVAIASIAAGDNNIGNVDIASAIPAGDNNIGNVDLASSLPAGTNAIGTVEVTALPALPVGANAIGTVEVTALPTLPAGTNNIGDVDVLSLPALPAGTNNIGDVDVLTLPALPAGTNNIGDVDVLTLPSLPAGTNNIGDVDVLTLPSVTLEAFPHANLGAFGDLETMDLTPVLQLSFATGLRDQLITSTVANSATVDANTGRLRLQTGTNAAGSAIASSVRPVAYRPGQGVTARLTPIWAGSAADSRQLAGMGNTVDGYFWGYNGTAFSICHRLSGVDTWVAQGSWNGDKCNGTGPSSFTMDPTKGNVLQIKYPYLGHGNIRFYVLNPATSLWILAHTIRYANTSAVPQLTNPLLNFHAEAVNVGNTSNLISYVTCAAAFIDGERMFLGPMFGVDNTKNTTTNEGANLSLKNATTINGAPNRGVIRLRQVSVSNSGNTWSLLRLRKGATLGGSPAYTPVSGSTADNGATLTAAQSIASFDVAGTTSASGIVVFNAVCGPSAAYVVDLTPYEIHVAPGEIYTFSVQSGANSTCTLAVNFQEDVQ